MTLKFFLRIRIDSNQIESNANSNRIKSNPVFLSSNRIELKLERIELNRITLKFDSNRFVRNLKYSCQAHKFCAQKGLAPQLVGNEIIPNTCYSLIMMEDLKISGYKD